MHIFPPPLDFPLFADPGREGHEQAVHVPFQYFVHYFLGGIPTPQKLLEVYRELLLKAEAVLGVMHHELNMNTEDDGDEEEDPQPAERRSAVAHNVVVDKGWIMVIPRREGGLDELGANAASMLGLVWVKNEDVHKKWMEAGPEKVLGHCGVPL
jgi:ATP adenylyltransferase/5',5'''-P-1,P-4-tetraphosphate phosphorylase II